MRSSMSKLGWIAWAALWIGLSLLMLVLGVGDSLKQRAFFAKAEQATATIIDYVPDRNPKVSDFCPELQFTTKAGQTIGFIGANCLPRADYSRVGQQEQIYYDPQDPRYTVQTRDNENGGLFFFMAMSAFFSLFWLVPLVVALVRKLIATATPSAQPYAPPPNHERSSYTQSSGLNDTMRQDAERYHANQLARERKEHAARPHPPQPGLADSVAAEEARLAQLKQQADELQRQIDEHRRQRGN